MGTIAALNRAARRVGLRFLVIGGHAVNASGYSRVTLDLDLLVSKDDRAAWETLLTGLGYSLFHDGGSFLQLTAPPGAEDWPLDLMLVARETLDAMVEEARTVEIEGEPVAIPAVLHLVALKLHALKSGGFERQGRDYLDIVGLIRGAGLDPRGAELQRIFERHGTEEWRERIVAACSTERR